MNTAQGEIEFKPNHYAEICVYISDIQYRICINNNNHNHPLRTYLQADPSSSAVITKLVNQFAFHLVHLKVNSLALNRFANTLATPKLAACLLRKSAFRQEHDNNDSNKLRRRRFTPLARVRTHTDSMTMILISRSISHCISTCTLPGWQACQASCYWCCCCGCCATHLYRHIKCDSSSSAAG